MDSPSCRYMVFVTIPADRREALVAFVRRVQGRFRNSKSPGRIDATFTLKDEGRARGIAKALDAFQGSADVQLFRIISTLEPLALEEA